MKQPAERYRALCWNCTHAEHQPDSTGTTGCTARKEDGSLKARCPDYQPEAGHEPQELDCDACTHRMAVYILAVSDDTHIIQQVRCNTSRKNPVVSPRYNCPKFEPEVAA